MWHNLNLRFGGSKHSFQPSQMSLDSLGIGDDINRQMYIKTVHYKGNVVAMKDIKYTAINRSLMLELKFLKDMQHDHIVRFLGACLDQGKIVFIHRNVCIWLNVISHPSKSTKLRKCTIFCYFSREILSDNRILPKGFTSGHFGGWWIWPR